MKKFYLLLVMALVAMVSCESNPAKEETPTEPAALTLVSEPKLNFNYDGGQGVVEYTLANVAEGELPVAETAANWVSNIVVGDETITFDVAVNEVEEVRNAVLFVSYGELSFNVQLVQAAAPHKADVVYTAKALNGEYYGTKYSPGYNYFLVLSTNGTTGFSDLYLDTYYRFDIFSATPAGDPVKVPVGVYEFDEYSLGNAGTFGFEYSMRFETCTDGTYKENYVLGGTLTVTENRIEAMVTLDDGKLHHVIYEGDLNLSWIEFVNEPPYSRLEKDYAFEYNTAMMRLFYYGDLYNVGGVNWTIQLTDDANALNGDYFSLDLVSDNLLATAEGVVGTYTAVADENSVAKSTFIAGTEGNKTGQYYNSWYWVIEEGLIVHSKGAPISKGTISITKDGNSYVVTLDTEDDNGHKVTGSYTCQNVEFYDRTKE